ncbi:hydroxymyristoyl-ACP dehydratase [Streptomyces pactum]|uniref:Hydroxymyristoyl-ACP dehydratase n=1 Tax=Streptomyces pactum TaxID=68249 RepID=A0ABS0NT72_9ACTN|nr:hydroxymyristoyl-ACP dehydratase [Streptomyces pactum]MBH5338413.1 hydroxymyristoyl-ACP dehydratase [Streptomyces pactum]
MTAFDEVIEVEPGRRAVAARHVTHTLGVFATHFPRFPVLPGVLILDDLVGAARLAAPEPPPGTRWKPVRVRRVRYRHFACPGDRLVFTATVTEDAGDAVTVRAVASVGPRDVTTVRELRLAAVEVAA